MSAPDYIESQRVVEDTPQNKLIMHDDEEEDEEDEESEGLTFKRRKGSGRSGINGIGGLLNRLEGDIFYGSENSYGAEGDSIQRLSGRSN